MPGRSWIRNMTGTAAEWPTGRRQGMHHRGGGGRGQAKEGGCSTDVTALTLPPFKCYFNLTPCPHLHIPIRMCLVGYPCTPQSLPSVERFEDISLSPWSRVRPLKRVWGMALVDCVGHAQAREG